MTKVWYSQRYMWLKSHGELSYLTGKIHRLQQRARAKEQAVFLLFDCERMFVYRSFNISLCKKKNIRLPLNGEQETTCADYALSL